MELNSPGTPRSSHSTLGEYSVRSADGLWQNKKWYMALEAGYDSKQFVKQQAIFKKQGKSFSSFLIIANSD